MGEQKINIPKLGIFLGVLAAFAAGILAQVSASTKTAIEANLQKKINTALEQVLPEFDNKPAEETVVLESSEGWPVTFYIAKKAGKVVGYAGKVVTPEGFSGDVTVMVGLELDGKVRTVIVTDQAETPGLGTAVTDRKVKKTLAGILAGNKCSNGLPPNKYLDWYAGKKAGNARWPIVKDGPEINGKTGATITSRAVDGAIFAISRTCLDHLDELSKGKK